MLKRALEVDGGRGARCGGGIENTARERTIGGPQQFEVVADRGGDGRRDEPGPQRTHRVAQRAVIVSGGTGEPAGPEAMRVGVVVNRDGIA